MYTTRLNIYNATKRIIKLPAIKVLHYKHELDMHEYAQLADRGAVYNGRVTREHSVICFLTYRSKDGTNKRHLTEFFIGI